MYAVIVLGNPLLTVKQYLLFWFRWSSRRQREVTSPTLIRKSEHCFTWWLHSTFTFLYCVLWIVFALSAPFFYWFLWSYNCEFIHKKLLMSHIFLLAICLYVMLLFCIPFGSITWFCINLIHFQKLLKIIYFLTGKDEQQRDRPSKLFLNLLVLGRVLRCPSVIEGCTVCLNLW